MAIDRANAIIFIFIATYNLFQASEDAVMASLLQENYLINFYLHTVQQTSFVGGYRLWSAGLTLPELVSRSAFIYLW